MSRKICFVVMPFSKKKTDLDSGKGPVEVDFDALWQRALAPLIEDLGYAPVRADADTGSLIINAMIERLAYADLVLADISIPNANVYYEIGVRHAARRSGCVLIAADWTRPVFDVTQMRRLSYPLPDGTVSEETAKNVRESLLLPIRGMFDKVSPVHEVVPGIVNLLDTELPSLDRAKRELYEPERVAKFRADMDELSNLMADMRRVHSMSAAFEQDEKRKEALAIRDRVESAGQTVQDSVRLEIMRLLRDCVGWRETLEYIDAMPETLRLRPEVQEQRLLALAKEKDSQQAIAHLNQLIDQFGPSSERYGLIGGRYKQLYRVTKQGGNEPKASFFLNKAIDAYTQGMLQDLNDYYPSSNLPQLLRARGEEGDAELAQFATNLTLRTCERARQLNREDEWLRPTLLGAAFDAEDVAEADRLVRLIEAESSAAWKLETTLADLQQRVTQVKDEGKRQKLQTALTRMEKLLPPNH
jgi:tetratricopeptide (TPR) repeat protein